MGQTCWPALGDGRYVIDVVLGNQVLQVMVDTGLVDPLQQVGFELEPSVYDPLDQSGRLTNVRARQSRSTSGRFSTTVCGMITARLFDPVTSQGVGPVVPLFASRGATGVPNRCGLVFFHGLIGCRVSWDLSHRTWSVEYP